MKRMKGESKKKQSKQSKREGLLLSGDGKGSEGRVGEINGRKREMEAKMKTSDDMEEEKEAENEEMEEEVRDAPAPKPKPKPNISPSPRHLEKPVKRVRFEEFLWISSMRERAQT